VRSGDPSRVRLVLIGTKDLKNSLLCSEIACDETSETKAFTHEMSWQAFDNKIPVWMPRKLQGTETAVGLHFTRASVNASEESLSAEL